MLPLPQVLRKRRGVNKVATEEDGLKTDPLQKLEALQSSDISSAFDTKTYPRILSTLGQNHLGRKPGNFEDDKVRNMDL